MFRDSNSSSKKSILFCVYSHIEYYPPSINVLMKLSNHFEKISVVHRPIKKMEWKWPDNITFKKKSKVEEGQDTLNISNFKKLINFLSFFREMYMEISKSKPQVLILSDPYSLLSYTICRFLGKKRFTTWYHSHDVIEQTNPEVSRFTLQYWATLAEKKAFSYLDLFTLPSESRLKFYDTRNLKGDICILPNYPSLSVFQNVPDRSIKDEVTLIFWGSIAEGRGLEQIIEMLPCHISGKSINLLIIGFIGNPQFLEKLKEIVNQKNAHSYIKIVPPVAYYLIPDISSLGHIGLGYYLSDSTMDTTILTASNKIYEYAALGLPVISNLSIPGENWCLESKTDRDSLIVTINHIISNYDILSENARRSVEEKYNFEKAFNQFLEKGTSDNKSLIPSK